MDYRGGWSYDVDEEEVHSMKRSAGWFIGIVLMSITISLGAISTVGGSEYNRGKDVFDSNCTLCHGKDGAGDGPAAAGFTPRPADFTSSKFWKRKDIDQVITKTIRNGHGPMPPIDLTSEQIKTVIDYISHAFKPGGN
jgi:cytochrome c5